MSRSDRPDLVLVMTDQQRHDQVGYRGVTPARTPTLDRLAGAGVAFTNAYSAATTCVPARTALLTGSLDHRVRRDEEGFLVEGAPTLPRALREVGYRTGLVGKAHFHPLHADHGYDVLRVCEHLGSYPGRLDPEAAGEDYHAWLVTQGWPDHRLRRATKPDVRSHPTSWVRDQAISVLEQRDPDRPLHLVVSFPHPHPPLDPPAPYGEMYRPEEAAIDAAGAEANRYLPHVFRKELAQEDHPHRRIDPERIDEHRAELARTYGLITQIDDAVASVLEHVDLDRTLLVFTSDHGDFAGHRGLLRKVPWIPFDDLAKVALFATGAGVQGGRVLDQPVQSFDLVPTFLEAAGVPSAEWVQDGRSLLPVLADPDRSPDDDRVVFSAVDHGWPMARRGPHKYIRSAGWGNEVLFDVDRDPDEVWNLTGLPEAAPIVEDLAAEVDRQLAATLPAGTPA